MSVTLLPTQVEVLKGWVAIVAKLLTVSVTADELSAVAEHPVITNLYLFPFIDDVTAARFNVVLIAPLIFE